MPKDTQAQNHRLNRQERTTLRELAHIRRHQLLARSQDVEPCLPKVRAVSVDGADDAASENSPASTPLDTRELEAWFSALRLGSEDGTTTPTNSHPTHYNLKPLPAQVECGDSEEVGEMMEGVQSSLFPTPTATECPTAASPETGGTALDQALRANASLRRRMIMHERHVAYHSSQVKLQKQTVANLEKEAAGARRLVLIAEERFRKFEHKIEKLREESYRYCRGWLAENRSVRDLLAFVADPSDPNVGRIASSSRERFRLLYSDETLAH